VKIQLHFQNKRPMKVIIQIDENTAKPLHRVGFRRKRVLSRNKSQELRKPRPLRTLAFETKEWGGRRAFTFAFATLGTAADRKTDLEVATWLSLGPEAIFGSTVTRVTRVMGILSQTSVIASTTGACCISLHLLEAMESKVSNSGHHLMSGAGSSSGSSYGKTNCA
jgi:hypothetical protein